MPTYIKQINGETKMMVSDTPLTGFTKISPELETRVLDTIIANKQFKVEGDDIVLAPEPYPAEASWFNFDNNTWVKIIDTQNKWIQVRAQREELLKQSDWVSLPDVTMPENLKQLWFNYRQQLRDVTDQPDPYHIIWPTPPQ